MKRALKIDSSPQKENTGGKGKSIKTGRGKGGKGKPDAAPASERQQQPPPTLDAALVAQLKEARQMVSRPTFCRAFAYNAESCPNPDGCCPRGAHIPRAEALKIDGFRKQWKEGTVREATPAPKAEPKTKAKARARSGTPKTKKD